MKAPRRGPVSAAARGPRGGRRREAGPRSEGDDLMGSSNIECMCTGGRHVSSSHSRAHARCPPRHQGQQQAGRLERPHGRDREAPGTAWEPRECPGEWSQLIRGGEFPEERAGCRPSQWALSGLGEGAGRRSRAKEPGEGVGRRSRAKEPGEGARRRSRAKEPGEGAGRRSRAKAPRRKSFALAEGAGRNWPLLNLGVKLAS